MTPAEKRYFKRHYGADTNKLTHLFDAINAQHDYDEQAIKDQFKDKMASNLKVYKFQLEQLLLKSLASHRDQSTHAFKWRSTLSGFDVLLDKGLLTMAGKQLEKLRQLTEEREGRLYLASWADACWRLRQAAGEGLAFARNIQVTCQPGGNDTDFFSRLPALNEAVDRCLDRCFARQSQPEISPEALKVAPTIPADDAELLAYLTLAFQRVAGDEPYSGAEQLLHFRGAMDQDPERRQRWAGYYLAALRCLIRMSLGSGSQQIANELIAEGRAFIQAQPAFLAQSVYFEVLNIRSAIRWGALEEALSLAEEKWEILRKEEEVSDKPGLWLLAWIALGSICAGKAEPGQRFISLLKEQKEDPVFRDLGWILEIIRHFAGLADPSPGDYLAGPVWKKAKAKCSSTLFFPAFEQVCREMVRDEAAGRVEIERLRARNEAFMADPLFRLFSRLELDQWLLARREGRPLARQLREQKAPDLSLC